ncbi:MAG: hypothetical protein U0136_03740 [Bdellovibrionota bacterium]
MRGFRSKISTLVSFGAAIIVSGSSALACDLCAIYSAQNMKDSQSGSFTVGAAEQFTSFNSVRLNGDWVPNEAHQSLSSSVLQLYGRYDFTDAFGAQINLPYINRHFKRPENGELAKGSESGIGDMSVLGLYTPVRVSDGDFFARLSVRGGLKLPTGDSGRIEEETEEGDAEAAASSPDAEEEMVSMVAHAGHDHGGSSETPSGIHGHDLALGSGSIDYILGTTGFIEDGRLFGVVDVQYAIRTEGDFDYRYQNDLAWSLGAGAYLLTEHEATISLKANLSGEYKGMDIFDGNKAEDTGMNSMFLGPEIGFTVGENIFGLLAVDLPFLLDNTSFQAVPDYRLRFGVTYRF